MNRSYNMNMCEGPLTGKIVRYALPLVATYLLQHAFHLADIIVIGQFAETSKSLAAIGTTGDLNALVLNLIWGVSVGANVVVAQCYGAQDRRSLVHAVHTSLALALCFGVLVCVAGVAFAPYMLSGINAQGEVLRKATLYWRICLFGAPFMLVYNYCCSVLRALGDTRRPLLFLSISGIANVVLNVVFVTAFKMDVAGVALATALSQLLSAVLVLRVMVSSVGPERIMLRHVRFYWPEVRRMLHIGVPAGIQGAFFSISNVIIMAAINTLGHEATAGNVTACQIEGVMYVIVIAMYQTAMAFSGQNYGAKKYDRVRRSVLICTWQLTLVVVVLSTIGIVFGEKLLGFITPDRAVVAQAESRMYLTLSSYFLLGFMDIATGGLRGVGRSVFPAVVSLLGACVFRIIWVETAFERPEFHSLRGLLISYPISWGAVAFVNGGMFFLVVHLLIRKQRRQAACGGSGTC
jgi:putative MATE family efflux protein